MSGTVVHHDTIYHDDLDDDGTLHVSSTSIDEVTCDECRSVWVPSQ